MRARYVMRGGGHALVRLQNANQGVRQKNYTVTVSSIRAKRERTAKGRKTRPDNEWKEKCKG